MTHAILRSVLWTAVLIFPSAAGQSVEAAQIPAGTGDRVRLEATSSNTYDPQYLGKPLSYWLKSIRNRDTQMDLAFDAIRHLGPSAYPAVPELTAILAAPFPPIHIGVDGYDVIVAKLLDIQVHSDAVDGLAAIGDAAAPSAKILAEWALTTRVILTEIHSSTDKDLFIDIVGIDVLERMRVAGTIAQFHPSAALLLADLLSSKDEEAQKLGVAILSEHALPIATGLLKSKYCENQKQGMKLLFDMWPVVAMNHLLDLQEILKCTEPIAR